MSVSQSAGSVLMVSPASFGFDSQTARSNTFQVEPATNRRDTTAHAMVEFNQAVDKLRQANIDIHVHKGDPARYLPNAVFPNNWLSTWPNGKVFLYPMSTASRRHERESGALELILDQFSVRQTIDLSGNETDQKYLESTGVIVFDHLEKIAYACLSPRCDEELFNSHVKSLGYKPVSFHGVDQLGVPIYHTNVMMSIQTTTAVICSAAIADKTERQEVLALLGRNREVIDISFEQMGAFCGNVLEVKNLYQAKVLVLSQSAFNAFNKQQLDRLSIDKTLVAINIPTIEAAGGGSARCMLAEIFLPPIETIQHDGRKTPLSLA